MQREYGIGQKGLSPFKFTTNWNNDLVVVKFEEDKRSQASASTSIATDKW